MVAVCAREVAVSFKHVALTAGVLGARAESSCNDVVAPSMSRAALCSKTQAGPERAERSSVFSGCAQWALTAPDSTGICIDTASSWIRRPCQALREENWGCTHRQHDNSCDVLTDVWHGEAV
jgi:hypothetical protein